MNNYFDYAASTPVSDSVLEKMQPWLQHHFANSSASHFEGQKAFDAITKARAVIADKIGALPSEIIFTSGASEANNFAIKGIAFKNLRNKGHIITSCIEHKCILNTCSYLETLGFDITYLSPTQEGVITPQSVCDAIKSNTILISIHHVNNELGTIQPISDIGSIAFEHEILFHTDAAQSFCKLNINVDDMCIDMLSLSGHKIYGPKGIGALYVREARNSNLVPLIHGGGQELGLRGGTSPTPLIVGLGEAVSSFPVENARQMDEFRMAINNFEYRRNGGVNVVPTIWNVTFPDDKEIKLFKDKYQWLISQGSACNAMSNVASHVLSAIGLDESEARRTYRISLAPFSVRG